MSPTTGMLVNCITYALGARCIDSTHWQRTGSADDSTRRPNILTCNADEVAKASTMPDHLATMVGKEILAGRARAVLHPAIHICRAHLMGMVCMCPCPRPIYKTRPA